MEKKMTKKWLSVIALAASFLASSALAQNTFVLVFMPRYF
jgi:hypothetical protein